MPWQFSRLARAGALVCVLLVFLTSFVAVVHFHADDSMASDHSCTLCALAHTGIAPNRIPPPTPVFVPSTLAEVPADTAYRSLPVFSYCIRPPPAA
ncbi:MAG: DUF2607 family protein [Acidobacteria bacterium]|nr:DUF2607 family protein [Acidobacteriota bacterium]